MGAAARIPEVELTTAAIEGQIRPLYRRLGFKPGWVEAVTGIGARRMWSPGVRPVDAAVDAGRAALADAGMSADQLQVVVSCSVTKSRLEPSLACEIQAGLGVGHTCANYDVANACLGFLTGMVQVANMIALGQIEAGLVVAAEDARPVLDHTIAQLRKPGAGIVDFKDHLATLTLGSAAAAMVLARRRPERPGHKLFAGTTRSAAHHHDLCVGDLNGMVTDSVRLLREGVALAGQTWADMEDLTGWTPDQVGVAAMHQVGKAHHDTVIRHLQVPSSRAPQIYPWLGNVGACGVPVTAILARDQGMVQPGTEVALMGIGSGLNVMMLGVTW